MVDLLDFGRLRRVVARTAVDSHAHFCLGRMLSPAANGLSESPDPAVAAAAQELGELQRALDAYIQRRRVVELDKSIRFLTCFAAVALGHDGCSWSPPAVETLASGLIAALDTQISDFEQINVPVINEIVTASTQFLEISS